MDMASFKPESSGQPLFSSALLDEFPELLGPFPESRRDSTYHGQHDTAAPEEPKRSPMSLALLKGMFSRYSPLDEQLPSRDAEKDVHIPFQKELQDLESTAGSSTDNERVEKSSFKIVDARIVSDAIIGLSDGMTVPFALTAGLSALGDTKVVVFGGMAELIAGAISMGLGGYLGAKSEE